jgi:thiamine pyrophosphokinase
MKEQIEIIVLVNIEYNEGHRETAIREVLDAALTWDIRGSSSSDVEYNIEQVKSKVLITTPVSEKFVDDCKYHSDMGQGRHNCTIKGFFPKKCQGVCKDFKEK